MKNIERQQSILWKFMPNGNIRFYQDTPDKRGVSEMQINNPKNDAMTVTTAHEPKVLIYEEQ